MVYEIIEIGEEVGPKRRTYLLVHFWETQADKTAGKPPVIIEDFYLGIPDTVQVPYVRPSGWWEDLDGNPVNPQIEVDGEWRPRSTEGMRMISQPTPIAEWAVNIIDNWTQQARAEPEKFYRRAVDPNRRTVKSGRGQRADLKALVGKVRKAPTQRVELPRRGQ